MRLNTIEAPFAQKDTRVQSASAAASIATVGQQHDAPAR
jgi:hypothetical protein